MMMRLPSIYSLVLLILKIRDKDPLSELSSTNLAEVSRSPLIVNPIQK
jgi:hypothetical protein